MGNEAMEVCRMSFSILGTGKAVPEYVLTNDELSTMVETNDEWIRTRTGIEERHVCKSETLTELTVRAAKNAMEDAGVTADMLDLIICSTMRGENITPSQACMIQKEIGASCPAFDVNAAFGLYLCAGCCGRLLRKKKSQARSDRFYGQPFQYHRLERPLNLRTVW